MLVGVNATKDAIFIAETCDDDGEFTISKITRLQFQLASAEDLHELLKNLKTLFASFVGDAEPGTIALLCCPSGQYGSSVEAVKAEAMAQLAAHEMGISVIPIKPQSLKSALGCAATEKWQARSKELLNPQGQHKHWSNGANGAAAAAYKVSQS
jgi:hypothetical protein